MSGKRAATDIPCDVEEKLSSAHLSCDCTSPCAVAMGRGWRRARGPTFLCFVLLFSPSARCSVAVPLLCPSLILFSFYHISVALLYLCRSVPYSFVASLSFSMSVSLSQPISQSIRLSISISTYLPTYLSIYLPACLALTVSRSVHCLWTRLEVLARASGESCCNEDWVMAKFRTDYWVIVCLSGRLQVILRLNRWQAWRSLFVFWFLGSAVVSKASLWREARENVGATWRWLCFGTMDLGMSGVVAFSCCFPPFSF